MPSPLREQIAHAIADALREAGVFTGTFADARQRECIIALGAADAVLPLVEAAAVAERQKIDAYIGSAERHFEAGLRRGAAAERLRLHTQLRDQITALRPRRTPDPWTFTDGLNAVLALLQPEEHDA